MTEGCHKCGKETGCDHCNCDTSACPIPWHWEPNDNIPKSKIIKRIKELEDMKIDSIVDSILQNRNRIVIHEFGKLLNNKEDEDSKT